MRRLPGLDPKPCTSSSRVGAALASTVRARLAPRINASHPARGRVRLAIALLTPNIENHLTMFVRLTIGVAFGCCTAQKIKNDDLTRSRVGTVGVIASHAAVARK